MTKRKLHLSSGVGGAMMPRRREKPLPRPVFFSHYMRELIEQLRLQGRYGTAANYEKTLRVFSKFMGGKELPLTAITGRTIADLHILQVASGCGCTTPKYTKKPIKPGKKGSIKVEYDATGRRPGYYRKSVTVYSNDPSSYVRLFIEGIMVE